MLRAACCVGRWVGLIRGCGSISYEGRRAGWRPSNHTPTTRRAPPLTPTTHANPPPSNVSTETPKNTQWEAHHPEQHLFRLQRHLRLPDSFQLVPSSDDDDEEGEGEGEGGGSWEEGGGGMRGD